MTQDAIVGVQVKALSPYHFCSFLCLYNYLKIKSIFLMPLFGKPGNWGSLSSHAVYLCAHELTRQPLASVGGPSVSLGLRLPLTEADLHLGTSPPALFLDWGVLSSAAVLGLEAAWLSHKPQAHSALRLPPRPPALRLGDPPPRFL